jgi:Domain of unknown function (DUF1127)
MNLQHFTIINSLDRLDDRMLADIGLTREAAGEAYLAEHTERLRAIDRTGFLAWLAKLVVHSHGAIFNLKFARG